MIRVTLRDCADDGAPLSGPEHWCDCSLREYVEANDACEPSGLLADVRSALRLARRGAMPEGGMLCGGGAAPLYRLAAWRASR